MREKGEDTIKSEKSDESGYFSIKPDEEEVVNLSISHPSEDGQQRSEERMEPAETKRRRRQSQYLEEERTVRAFSPNHNIRVR